MTEYEGEVNIDLERLHNFIDLGMTFARPQESPRAIVIKDIDNGRSIREYQSLRGPD
jgi:hypothetical protein